MPELQLPAAARRDLRSLAHHLDPVVMIGQHGASPAVLHEIDNALTAHELIKVRVQSDERPVRIEMLAKICESLSCAAVQHLGKLFVLFRPGQEDKAAEAAKAKTVKKERPRHTDFPKSAEMPRGPHTTRPPTAGDDAARPPARRARARDDDAWSDLPPSVRKRIDPNYSAPQEERERFAPRSPRAPRDARDARPPRDARAPRDPRDARPPRVPGARDGLKTESRDGFQKRSFGATGPQARRRLGPPASSPRSGADGAAAPAETTAARPASEKRFTWKDRDSFPPIQRNARPTTHSEPKKQKRGLARDPKAVAQQNRRRLKSST